jgi:serine/threonine protein kinase
LINSIKLFLQEFLSPECQPPNLKTKTSDVFSLGKVYCFSFLAEFVGFNFKQQILRKMRQFESFLVIKSEKGIRNLGNIKKDFRHVCAFNVIDKMTQTNPDDRPDCDVILNNILFWNEYKIYNFLKTINEAWNHLKDHKLFEKNVDQKWTNGIKGSYISHVDTLNLHGFVKYVLKKVCVHQIVN